MKSKKVAILLSSYNGEKYIAKQIETIMNQTYDNIQLYVRDDGSTDKSLLILEKLNKIYNFHLIKGENIGFLKSFFKLLEMVEDADYYAFADQDDIWLENKIEMAISWFGRQSEQELDKPLLYHASYNIANEDMQIIKSVCYRGEVCDFRRSLTDNYVSGFSMVINKKLRQEMLKGNTSKVGYHDWWAFLIAKGLGSVYFDERILSIHRMHETNETKVTLIKKFKWFWKTLQQPSEMKQRLCEFERIFGQELSCENQNYLKYFTAKKYQFDNVIKKVFYPKRWRSGITSEIVMRLLMLMGRI